MQYEVGDTVEVIWLDHQCYEGWQQLDSSHYELAKCTTWGRVLEIHETFIVVASTQAEGDNKDRTVGDVHALVLSACESIRKVRYGEESEASG